MWHELTNINRQLGSHPESLKERFGCTSFVIHTRTARPPFQHHATTCVISCAVSRQPLPLFIAAALCSANQDRRVKVSFVDASTKKQSETRLVVYAGEKNPSELVFSTVVRVLSQSFGLVSATFFLLFPRVAFAVLFFVKPRKRSRWPLRVQRAGRARRVHRRRGGRGLPAGGRFGRLHRKGLDIRVRVLLFYREFFFSRLLSRFSDG